MATAGRRALILSGRFGKGHDVVAEASAAALAPRGVEHRTLDAIALLGGAGSRAGEWVFRSTLAVAPLYDALHFSQLRDGGALARGLDALSLRAMWPRFLREADRFPPDLVLSVFATGAAAAGRYKVQHPDVTTAVLCTDAWVHRLWVHDGNDVYLVTSELGAASVRRYAPRARVELVPRPVRPAFYAAPARAEARAALGVDARAPCALLMSGSWGLGPLDDTAARLAAGGIEVLAVAGANARLEARLRTLAAREPRVHTFGFTDRVPELMSACDVVVTSSGDTCSEARALGRSLVLLDVVPGHGRENLLHELELGDAAVGGARPAEIVAAVEAFLADDDGRPERPRMTADAYAKAFCDALARAGFQLDGPAG